MSQIDDDYNLTTLALSAVVRAQQRGRLSTRMSISKHPTQVVLSSLSAEDLAWVHKRFGPEHSQKDQGFVRLRGKHRYEETQRQYPLREPVDSDAMFSRMVPRLEVWGIEVPHVCRAFAGRLRDGKVTWRCDAYRCNKVLTKTRARELGLLS